MKENIYEMKVARTQQLLKETLIQLMSETSFEKITVRDLTAKAQLSRGTFYIHYLDKYDLMEKIQNDLLEAIQERLLSVHIADAMQYDKQNRPYPPMVSVFDYIKSQGPMLKVLLGPKGDPSFAPKMKMSLKEGMFKRIPSANLILENVLIPSRFVSAFSTSALLGVIEEWVANGMEQTSEEMALLYFKIKFIALRV